MTATASYTQLDPACGNPSVETATSGNVIVSAIDRQSISGSFDLAFPNGDSVTGEFSGPACVVTLNDYSAPRLLVCLP